MSTILSRAIALAILIALSGCGIVPFVPIL
jgi:predicted small lipoprotein YifL